MRRRVLVTSAGLETCLGSTLEDFWSKLYSGVSGISPITLFDTSRMPCKVAGQVDYHPDALLSPVERRRLSRFQQLAVTSVLRACPEELHLDRSRTAVIVGSGGAGLPLMGPVIDGLNNEGWRGVDRLSMLRLLPNMAAGAIAERLNITGPVLTICTACAASTDAIGLGVRLIRSGEVDAAIVVGVDVTVSEVTIAGFLQLGVLSVAQDYPVHARSRPFDLGRSGMVPSEGAAALVLQAAGRATDQTEPLGEIVGVASTCDGFSLISPRADGSAAARVITQALEDGGTRPEEIDLVSAHGTGTRLNDVIETIALKAALGTKAKDIPVTAPKSMLGHTCGAGGAIELVAALLSLKHQYITPTTNLDSPDPDCDLDHVPQRGRTFSGSTVLKVSFGFGGHNSALVVKRPDIGSSN